jgi:hypothetical protein
MCPNPIVGSALRLTTTPTKTLNAAAAWNGTHAGVVYEEDGTTGELYFALLNADGTRAKSPDVLIASGQAASALTPDIAWTGSEFGVVWTNGYSSIMFRRLGADGTPKAGMVDITAATPGTKAPISAPRITWSPVYAGYAIVTLGYTGTNFQRIGADGTTPEAVNVTATGSVYGRSGVALSPAGEWSIAVRYSNSTLLAFYNPDGSKTKPVSTIDSWTYYNDVPVVVHDGSTWVTTYARNDGYIMVNRGAGANTPAALFKLPSNVYPKAFRTIVSSGGAYDLVELRDSLIRHYRFSLSQAGTTTVTPLTSETLVLSTPNALGLEALAVGPGKQLVLWADNRWGAEELYAAPVSLQNCP